MPNNVWYKLINADVRHAAVRLILGGPLAHPGNNFLMIIVCLRAPVILFVIPVYLACVRRHASMVVQKVMTKCHCPVARTIMCAICETLTNVFLILIACVTLIIVPLANHFLQKPGAVKLIALMAIIVMAKGNASSISIKNAALVMIVI